MSGEIVLSMKQILNLCEFAGIAINTTDCCFNGEGEQYLLETEYHVAQNEYGAVSWLEERPEEGVYPLSGVPHCLRKK